MTRSIPELDDDSFTRVRDGHAMGNAPILMAGAGTGFGVGFLIPTKNGYHVLPTEGGHVAYSSRTNLEHELFRCLKHAHDFVSLELVTSGKNLPEIHKALCDIHGETYEFLEPSEIVKSAHDRFL